MPDAVAASEVKPRPLPTKAQSNKLDRLILRWKRDYVRQARIKALVEAHRESVKAAIADAGLHAYESKYGRIALQTKKTIDWEALARSALKDSFIEQAIPLFRTESEQFISAPAFGREST